MLLDVFDQAILILPHLEKIVVFAESFYGTFAIGAETIGDIFLSPKPLIKRAIPSGIVSLVNQFAVVKLLKISLNHFLVLTVGGSYESVIGDVQPFPEVCELRREPSKEELV